MTHVLVKLDALAAQLPGLPVLTRDGELARLIAFLRTSSHHSLGVARRLVLLFSCVAAAFVLSWFAGEDASFTSVHGFLRTEDKHEEDGQGTRIRQHIRRGGIAASPTVPFDGSQGGVRQT
jgi:hypothetical protein